MNKRITDKRNYPLFVVIFCDLLWFSYLISHTQLAYFCFFVLKFGTVSSMPCVLTLLWHQAVFLNNKAPVKLRGRDRKRLWEDTRDKDREKKRVQEKRAGRERREGDKERWKTLQPIQHHGQRCGGIQLHKAGTRFILQEKSQKLFSTCSDLSDSNSYTHSYLTTMFFFCSLLLSFCHTLYCLSWLFHLPQITSMVYSPSFYFVSALFVDQHQKVVDKKIGHMCSSVHVCVCVSHSMISLCLCFLSPPNPPKAPNLERKSSKGH